MCHILRARIRRWWHCLIGTFVDHRGLTSCRNGEITWIGCECGVSFYGEWAQVLPPKEFLDKLRAEFLKGVRID